MFHTGLQTHRCCHKIPYPHAHVTIFSKNKKLISENFTTFKKRVLKTQSILSKLAMSLVPHLKWRFIANEVLLSGHKP